MKNPFVYGEVVSGKSFCNRVNEINELVNDIMNGTNVIIFSPRRYGKTSLIKEVLKIVKKKGLLTFYADLYPAISKQKFIEIYALAISSGIPGKASMIAKKLKGYLPRIIPKIVVNENDIHFEFDFDRSRDVSFHIDDLLEAAKKAGDHHKKKSVVVFDEFQEIGNFDNREIEKKMRSVFQNHRDVSYIFMGSKMHLMRDIFNNPNRPFYKSGKHFPLKKIAPDELAKFAADKFKSGKIKIGAPQINEVMKVTESHPYYFQMLCYVLWEFGIDQKAIEFENIERAVDILISRESSAFIAMWEGLTSKQKKLLAALAEVKHPKIYSKIFLDRYGLGAPSSVQKAIKNLIKQELIQQTNGSYEIYDLFFKRWIIRTCR